MVTVKNYETKNGAKNVLYEDKYVKVFKDHIEIKNYYFPTTSNKKISINDIQLMYYRQQNFPKDCFVSKDWGMVLIFIDAKGGCKLGPF
uniref:Uncharacterized protein n=1 Tax=Acrobeloides nanus TaxID=290746 RepID=A0A914DBL5_9BILA